MFGQKSSGLVLPDQERYFDITHSFQVGSATYHVLGLRQDRPTYGNQYYIFESSSAPPRAFLPPIRSPSRPTTTKGISESAVTKSISEQTQVFISALKEMKTEDRKELGDLRKYLERFQSSIDDLKSTLKDLSHRTTNIEKESNKHLQVFFSNLKEVENNLLETFNRRFDQIEERFEQNRSMDYQEDLLKELRNIRECQAEMNKKLNEGPPISKEQSPSSSLEQIRQVYMEHRDFLIYQQETLVKELRIIQDTQTTFISMMKTTETPSPLLVNSQIEQVFRQQIDSVTTLFQVEQKNLSIKLDSIQTNINAISTKTNIEGDKLVQVLTNRMEKLFDEQRELISSSLVSTTTIDHSPTVLMEQFFAQMRKSLTFLLVQLEQADGNRKATQISANEQCPFKVSIQTAEYADVYAKLFVNDFEYPQDQHTLCQRDPVQKNLLNCLVSPPLTSGTLALSIFAKTRDEDQYRAAITVEMPVSNIQQGSMFPQLLAAFHQHQCILVEPLQRFVQLDDELPLHLVLPKVLSVKIQNGDRIIHLGRDELPQGTLQMTVQVRGTVTVRGQWSGKGETNICVFNLTEKLTHSH